MNKPEIIVLCGIPCSGKSSWARTHREIQPCVILSRDTLRELSFGKDYKLNSTDEDKITKLFGSRYLIATIARRDIILDNTHCKDSYLNAEIKRKPVNYTLRIIFFDCSLWKAYCRNVIRWIRTGKFIPFKVIKSMHRSYKKIDKSKYSQYI